MTKGILLIAFGHPSYLQWAYNMAYSIKYYSPIPITLFCSPELSGVDLSIFDRVIYEIMPVNDDGRINVAQIKVDMSRHTDYDQTIYLDVDGCAIKDISPLFEQIFKDHHVYSQALGTGGRNDNIGYSLWASNETIWSHYGLKENAILCGIQSSIVAWDKSPESAKFFKQLQQNYARPIANLTTAWGESKSQPDELYFQATFAQMGIVPDVSIQPVYFPKEHTNKLQAIVDNHYILSLWGAKNMARPFAKEWYNRIMHKVFAERGMQHFYKSHKLYDHKFLGKKR